MAALVDEGLPGPRTKTPRYFPYGIAFHPHELLLAQVGENGASVQVWDLRPSSLAARPCARATSFYSNANVTLVGASGVGKTGLGIVLAGEAFKPTLSTHKRLVRTIPSTIVEEDGSRVHREVLLWDLAGQQGYRVLHQLALRDTNVALVVFDGRSQSDPFLDVAHYGRVFRQLKNVQSFHTKKYLVAARIDMGPIAATPAKIHAVLEEHGFDGFFEASAKDGVGTASLLEKILAGIAWDHLPKVSSGELFEQIRAFVEEQRETTVLATVDQLYHRFDQAIATIPVKHSRDEFETCIGLLEACAVVRKLSFGGLVLLEPELLDSYAASILNGARADVHGLGSILEETVRSGEFFITADDRLEDK